MHFVFWAYLVLILKYVTPLKMWCCINAFVGQTLSASAPTNFVLDISRYFGVD